MMYWSLNTDWLFNTCLMSLRVIPVNENGERAK